jgi:hypothetical protein
VGFIEHNSRILGQNATEIVLLQSQICEKEVVIHDDEIGIFGTLVHVRDETLVELGALLAGAGIAAGVQAGP